ncbi:MAG: hypothetical protein WCW77_04485 [Patescibacteria group bacterium]|jgi:hypothetical protein
MKTASYILSIVLVATLAASNFAFALITCPAGSHTFSGGTQASGYDMCIPDVPGSSGSSGSSSGSSGQSSSTFIPSSKGTITPSGTTYDTQVQGTALDAQVDTEVNRLYGTSIYDQAKALYDASIVTNRADYNSVVEQIKGLDYDAADSLKRAYNVRAIERLNQVWTGIIALENTYAEQQKQLITTPSTISPTPISPTPISPTPITPTPINPTSVIPQSISASDLKPGKTFTAPANQPTSIVKPDQSIFLKAGSAIKYIDQYTWQTVNGVFRFLEKTAINGRYKVRVNGGNAVVSIRGTQFIVNETKDTTTLTLIKGSLTIKPAKGASVTLKEGYQLVVTKGVLGKAVKYNAAKLDTSWYLNIQPAANFTNSSWQKTSAAANWSSDCTTTARQAAAAETLTADEQTQLDLLNQAIPVFKAREIDSLELPNKISANLEKTTVSVGTKYLKATVIGKSLFYSNDKTGKVWKVFQDKSTTDGMLKSAKSHNIVFGINKSTMAFDHWEKSGNTRIAVFSAALTQDGTDSLISGSLSSEAGSSANLGSVNIYISEDTQQWIKTQVKVDYLTGKVIMPIYQTCTYAYDKVKIKAPKAKSVTSKAGIAEMQEIYNAAQ